MRKTVKHRCLALARWLALAALLVLLLRPELQWLAPLADTVGAVGVDGLLLLIECQVALAVSGVLRGTLGPWLTRLWNRRVAAPRGRPPRRDILADGVLWVCHGLLCHGGRFGLACYLTYIALNVHLAGLGVPATA